MTPINQRPGADAPDAVARYLENPARYWDAYRRSILAKLRARKPLEFVEYNFLVAVLEKLWLPPDELRKKQQQQELQDIEDAKAGKVHLIGGKPPTEVEIAKSHDRTVAGMRQFVKRQRKARKKGGTKTR
jgi:hypothetical protein